MLTAVKKPVPKVDDRGNVKKKEHVCFLCNGKYDEKGIPLLISQTTFSRICLGEKLQEILGEKFVVLITSKDAICWACAKYINWVDKCERKLDLAKGNILNMVVTKYKNAEMNVESIVSKESRPRSGFIPVMEALQENPLFNPEGRKEMEALNDDYKKKNVHQCHICYKMFGSPAALGVHKARQHPTQRVCNICGLILSTDAKYKAHLAKHAAKTLPTVSQKLLSCVSCGFQTKNMEAYCRHVCDSKIVSLVCSSCRKRYIHKSASNIPGQNLCTDCMVFEGSAEVVADPEVSSSQKIEAGSPAVHPDDDEGLTLDMEVESEHVEPSGTRVGGEIPGGELTMDASELSLTELNHSDSERDERYEDQPIADVGQVESQPETISSDLHNEMPEFFRPPQEKRPSDQNDDQLIDDVIEDGNEIQLPVDPNSLLKCTNCNEEFEVNQLATHPCFMSGDALEYSEVNVDAGDMYAGPVTYIDDQSELIEFTDGDRRPRGGRRRVPRIPAQENIHFSHFTEPETKMHCKTCYAEFRTIGLMRQHWDLTGHSREVSTTTIELNKIKDKSSRTEQTFKVVKQNFSMRANVIGQNDDEIRRNDEAYTNCIVKVKDSPTIEEFMLRRDGKMCENCGIIFGDAQLLEEHQCTSCLTCVTCHVTFMDEKLLRKHYQYTGHASKAYKKDSDEKNAIEHPVIDNYFCPKCHKTFPARIALCKHLKTHYKGTTGGMCHYCLFEFEDKSMIQPHVLEAHGAYLYKCEHCDRAFLTKTVRNKHQLKHVIHMCKVCKVKFKNQRLLIVHMDKVHRSKACRICGKMITDVYALRRHERRHFYETNLKCDFCERTFRNKSSLRAHNRVHDEEIQFRCKTCHLGFKTPRNLEDHEIVHIKKQYQCTKCSTICPSRNFYWMHMKLHEAAYKCGVCGQMFRDTSLLAIHKRKHFRARPYQCPRCPRVFSVPATLRRHLTVHTRTYPFKCGLCKKGFLTKYAYHKHLDTVHALRTTHPRRTLHRIPSLPLNATDEDILQAADTLIAEDAIMFNDYHKDITVEQVPSGEMITEEVVVETTELFDEILH